MKNTEGPGSSISGNLHMFPTTLQQVALRSLSVSIRFTSAVVYLLHSHAIALAFLTRCAQSAQRMTSVRSSPNSRRSSFFTSSATCARLSMVHPEHWTVLLCHNLFSCLSHVTYSHSRKCLVSPAGPEHTRWPDFIS